MHDDFLQSSLNLIFDPNPEDDLFNKDMSNKKDHKNPRNCTLIDDIDNEDVLTSFSFTASQSNLNNDVVIEASPEKNPDVKSRTPEEPEKKKKRPKCMRCLKIFFVVLGVIGVVSDIVYSFLYALNGDEE